MKKAKLVIQKILFKFSLNFSQRNHLEHMICGSTSSSHSYHFFRGLGPKILIVRDGDIHYLGSALAIEAKFNEKGKMEYCRPMCMGTQKSDQVFFGKKAVYKEFEKYRPKFENTSGLSIIV